jgi:hypothetical protein
VSANSRSFLPFVFDRPSFCRFCVYLIQLSFAVCNRMPLVLNQSQGAHDRSFPHSLLHSPLAAAPGPQPFRHRRTRSLQNQKFNRHQHTQSLPRIIDQFPRNHHSSIIAYSPTFSDSYHLPAIASIQVVQPIAVEPIPFPSPPISLVEMEHQRPRQPDEPIDDHEWVCQTSHLIAELIVSSGLRFCRNYTAGPRVRQNASVCLRDPLRCYPKFGI